MNEEEISWLVENPLTFNYAVTCAAFSLEGDTPQILLVKYQEKPGYDIDVKLPAGRFQLQDLNKTIGLYFKLNGINYGLLAFSDFATKLNKEYLASIKNVKKHEVLNQLFNEFTAKLLDEFLLCNLSEQDLKFIFKQTQKNTVIHELEEETDAMRIGNLYLTSVSQKGEGHCMIGYTSVEIEAPINYKGSPDRKILESFWKYINNSTVNLIFRGHRTKFKEGIATITALKLHPNSDILKEYLGANN